MHDVYIFNTMGRKIQLFTPLHEGNVGFYGCGPTVYNYAHIGISERISSKILLSGC